MKADAAARKRAAKRALVQVFVNGAFDELPPQPAAPVRAKRTQKSPAPRARSEGTFSGGKSAS
jgi:hypothetical protein